MWQKARFPAVCSALLLTSSAPLRISSCTAQAHCLSPCTDKTGATAKESKGKKEKKGEEKKERRKRKRRGGKEKKREKGKERGKPGKKCSAQQCGVAFLGNPKRPPNDRSLFTHKTIS